MTQSLSSSLFNQQTKGMFGGPRTTRGSDGTGDLSAISGGLTYGGDSPGDFWNLYPGIIAGQTEFNPATLEPGSNREAVADSAEPALKKVGGGALDAQIPDYGGTAAY